MPPDEPSQIAQGERILRVLAGFGTQIVAEDLGSIPDFVRESLARLHVPGYKVLRWERHWDVDGKPFRDPASFPPLSLATTRTHDTETAGRVVGRGRPRRTAKRHANGPPFDAAGCRRRRAI